MTAHRLSRFQSGTAKPRDALGTKDKVMQLELPQEHEMYFLRLIREIGCGEVLCSLVCGGRKML
jgi:hypothetical protein